MELHIDLRLRLSATAMFLAVIVTPGLSSAQSGESSSTDVSFKSPLTADGQPDLQGHWTNDTYTPFERPAELGDKALYTPEEAAAFFKSRVDDLHAQAADDIHY